MSKRSANRSKHKSKVPGYHRLTKQERLDGMVQNGITPQDLEREYIAGYKQGRGEVAAPVFKTLYAAVCLALKDLHGFGEKRCYDVLCKIDEYVTYHLTSEEAKEEVFNRMGLELSFGDIYGTVSRRVKNGKDRHDFNG